MSELSAVATEGSAERQRLQARIEADKRELESALQDLKRTTGRKVRLGPRVAREPIPWIAGAFAVGFWFGWRNEQ